MLQCVKFLSHKKMQIIFVFFKVSSSDVSTFFYFGVLLGDLELWGLKHKVYLFNDFFFYGRPDQPRYDVVDQQQSKPCFSFIFSDARYVFLNLLYYHVLQASNFLSLKDIIIAPDPDMDEGFVVSNSSQVS